MNDDPKVEIVEEPVVTPPGEEVVPIPETPAKPETAPVLDLAALKAQLKAAENLGHGNRRIVEDLRTQITALTELVKSQAPKTIEPQKAGDGDFWSGVDPRAKGEIERVVEEKAQRLFQNKEAERQIAQDQTNRQHILDNSMEKVMAKYPVLSDDDSPESKLWLEILNERPELLSNPYGPLLTMQEFEERAPQSGLRLTPSRATAPRNGASLTPGRGPASLPASRPLQTNKTQMTREELTFCQKNGLDPATYKRNQLLLESGGSIEA